MATVLKGDSRDGDGDHNGCYIMMALVKVMMALVKVMMAVVVLCGSLSHVS